MPIEEGPSDLHEYLVINKNIGSKAKLVTTLENPPKPIVNSEQIGNQLLKIVAETQQTVSEEIARESKLN